MFIADGAVGVAMGNTYHVDVNDVPGTNSPKDVLHSMIVQPATLVYLERYHVHTFSNEGLTEAKIYAVWAPAGIENFFKAQVGLTLEQVSAMAPQYGLTFSSSADQYVESIVTGGSLHMDNHLDDFMALFSSQEGASAAETEAVEIKTWDRSKGVWALVTNTDQKAG